MLVPFLNYNLLLSFLFLLHGFAEVCEGGLAASTRNLTLVTAWYPHPGYNPKYPDEQYYRSRVVEFLARIHTPLVVFTPSSENDFLQSARPSDAPMLLNNSFESIWDVPYLTGLTHSFHTNQVKLAVQQMPGDFFETPHMWGVWNAKVFFLDEAAKENPFRSNYFFWHDAAGLLPRKGNLISWPDITRIREALSTGIGHPEKLLMVARELKPLRPVDASRELAPLTRTISAHFFGGTKGSIKWFSQAYYEMLAYYHSIDQFVGCEERIMLSIALLHPNRIACVPSFRCYDPTQVRLDHMYYYFLWLSGQETRLTKGPIRPVMFSDVPEANMFSYDYWARCDSEVCF
ncbi:hypothetical protein COCMIDRAFT_111522 [Bipolaris oryzae ATCC 44560]|uniref:Uncharacterized protein n=1 Tax=Bipolaris oryzae ATCC 44560 TaxID=930090 RepID=W6YJB6_COCMI|nr:uncharacterized protein COCMIDRAFT_111522 [Bipolaris oryzae ATCC 44560]EUC39462.1 hypothetical protein COCMIDRAFT_111522 [Bipolaris oryzae ATCC 44560]